MPASSLRRWTAEGYISHQRWCSGSTVPGITICWMWPEALGFTLAPLSPGTLTCGLPVLEKAPVNRLAGQALAERVFGKLVNIATGDMFRDRFPEGCDIHLFSNVLHDWDGPQVEQLLAKSYAALMPGGMIVVHDAHINAAKTGPLPVAAYSVLLMTISEGKCYSEAEMADLLARAGFAYVEYFPTVADRSVITARKR